MTLQDHVIVGSFLWGGGEGGRGRGGEFLIVCNYHAKFDDRVLMEIECF